MQQDLQRRLDGSQQDIIHLSQALEEAQKAVQEVQKETEAKETEMNFIQGDFQLKLEERLEQRQNRITILESELERQRSEAERQQQELQRRLHGAEKDLIDLAQACDRSASCLEQARQAMKQLVSARSEVPNADGASACPYCSRDSDKLSRVLAQLIA